ncbi:lipoprotein-releasing ABC transporter permease subunit [candidate division KSB1 bacterium]|nr:lipoprotein-releasing ABC transporter permease subunit [candidate division KSB1 bacterium]
MSYEFFIAKRYFRSKRRTGFISLINYFSIAGVMVGVAALIIVLSVMNGFENEVRSRIIGFDAHIRFRGLLYRSIENYTDIMDSIKQMDHVEVVSPYIFNKAFISHKNYQDGILIKGVDESTVTEVSDLAKNIIYGELNLGDVLVEGEPTLPGIVLGKSLALKLDVGLFDKVYALSLSGIKATPGLGMNPYVKPFRVTGYFETGLHDFDDAFAYISLESAQKLFKMGNTVTGCEIKLDDLDHANAVKQQIENEWGYKYVAETWFERNRNLFSWMQIEKWAAFIVLSLIIMVAAFNIISTLIMVVMEKKKDIGILKSMGATSKGIMRIFVYQGIISGVIGAVFGSIIGYVLCWSQLEYRWFSLPSDIYFISSLPVEMKVLDFVMIMGAAIFLCFLATIFPAKKAAQLDPVEAMRYE